jgi:hypothetical protein
MQLGCSGTGEITSSITTGVSSRRVTACNTWLKRMMKVGLPKNVVFHVDLLSPRSTYD